MQFLLGVLVGMVVTLKLFPPSLIKNEIEQTVKKIKDSPGSSVALSDTEKTPAVGHRFLGIFKRKNK